jgi:signal transduction histidine kinase/ActR/RegA family two-component response regulator
MRVRFDVTYCECLLTISVRRFITGGSVGWRRVHKMPSAGARSGRLRRWWLDRSVRAKGMIVIAVPLIFLIGLTSSTLVLLQNERQERHVATAASNLINAANQVLADAVDAQTGVLGYAATGDPLFLGPYSATAKRMPADLAALRAAAAAEGVTPAARAAEATAAREMAELALMRSEVSKGAKDVALRPQLEAGKTTTGTLRNQIAGLAQGPDALVAVRRNNINRLEDAIDAVVISGLALGVLAGVIGGVLFTSGIARRVAEAAANADRLGAGQDLDPARDARDEIGRLTGALTRAKRVLDSRTTELTAARDVALKATQAKNAFLSSTSHELRTPLNAVLGFTQLLQLSDLSQEDQDSVERILGAGRHLLALINELIDIARIESGEFSLSVEPVLVQPLVEETCQLMAPIAAARSITIGQYCLHPGLAVRADRLRLRQILVNLVSNAIKYNRQGGAVSITYQAEGVDRAVLVVTDTGPGISAANLERIFIPFERLGADQTAVEGTGIGLPLARAFAEAMAGQLSATSVDGAGSTFTITLPRVPDMGDVREHEAAASASLTAPAGPAGAGIRVLYIEDNAANIEVVSRFVKSRPNIRLQAVMSGRIGVEIAAREVPDLILLDLHLPDLHGHEVLNQLKAEPATAGIPIAILSAEAAPTVIRQMRSSGIIAYLTKPLDLSELGQLLDSLTAADEEEPGVVSGMTPT